MVCSMVFSTLLLTLLEKSRPPLPSQTVTPRVVDPGSCGGYASCEGQLIVKPPVNSSDWLVFQVLLVGSRYQSFE